MPTIDFSPLTPSFGAEIHGIDLAAELPQPLVDALRGIWLRFGVVFFRDQGLGPAQFINFARRIGTPVPYPLLKGLDGYPEITEIAKLPHQTTNFGGVWHSDTAYLAEPPMATLLLAREVPPAGGDTLWADMYAAYDALSVGMQRMLGGLVAVNSSALAAVSKTREDSLRESGAASDREYLATHPVVRTHPETGRKALYVSTAHTLRFEGFTEDESKPLLDWLTSHATRPEFVCRFCWRPGSLALWDNRCTMHYPINDYHGFKRVMHRITLQGDRPG